MFSLTEFSFPFSLFFFLSLILILVLFSFSFDGLFLSSFDFVRFPLIPFLKIILSLIPLDERMSLKGDQDFSVDNESEI